MKFHKANNPRKHPLCFLPVTNPHPEVTAVLTSNSIVLLSGSEHCRMEAYAIVL